MGATGPPGGFDIQNFFKGPQQYSAQQQGQFQPPQQNQFHHQNLPQNFISNNPPYPSSMGDNTYPSNAPTAAPNPTSSQTNPAMYQGYQQFQQEQHVGRPPPYPNNASGFNPPVTYSQPPPSQGTLRTSQPQATLESRSFPLPNPSTILQSTTGSSPQSTPLDGARLMALLTTHSATEGIGSNDDDLVPNNGVDGTSAPPLALDPVLPTAPPVNAVPPPARLAGSKVSRGRVVKGDRIVYDVDVHNPGEAQPQLEVSPITVYGSDPVPVQGRQIAVNRNYICYGLRQAAIRILNINTALKALLRGHTERISDMAFLDENSNLLASASSDGRVIVRNIAEIRVEGKVAISEHIVVAIQFVGDLVSRQPCICWHTHVKDLLVVAIGKYVVTIDLTRARAAAPLGGFAIDQPLLCRMDSPLEGVSVVGCHSEVVSNLAISNHSSMQIASASQDGTVQFWGDRKRSSLLSFTPHQGEAVGTVAFISAPGRADQPVLLTAGPLNREIKLWAAETDARSNPQTWQCLQTLVFDSSSCNGKHESAFFNQIVISPQGGLVLVANAKRNAIYTIHVQFGSSPMSVKMDYIAEFSVTMPILSLTIMEEAVTVKGDGTLQIYCIQTQAIQQFPLPVVQCLPPPEDPPKYGLSKGNDLESSSTGSIEKAVTGVVNKVNQAPNAGSGSMPTGIAQRAPELQNSGGFGDLLEGAGSERELPNATTEVTKPAEIRDQLYAMGQLTQAVPESQASATPTTQQVLLPESADAGSPPSTNIGRGTSTSVKDQRYVPVTTSQRQQAEKVGNTTQSRGRHNAEKEDQYTGKRRSSSLPRRVEDARDNQQCVPVSAGNVSQVIEKVEGSGENWMDSTAPGADSLEKADSETSSNSVPDDMLDKEEATTNKNSIQKQTGPIPTHLITPSELMSLAAGTKQMESETDLIRLDENMRETNMSLNKPFNQDQSQADTDILDLDSAIDDNGASDQSESSLKVEMGSTLDFQVKEGNLARFDSLGTSDFELNDAFATEDTPQAEESGEERDRPIPTEDIQDQFRDMVLNGGGDGNGISTLQAKTKKNNKNKTSGVLGGAVPLQLHILGGKAHHQAGSGDRESNAVFADLAAQVLAMQESINHLISMQSELQKQMTVIVAVPVAKEGKRMEGALGLRMEKVLKAHVDAMWARVAEESAKREKVERERVQHINNLLNSLVGKDMPNALERGFKKEFGALAPMVTQAVLPPLQKAISTAVSETFQRGISEKVLPQLEKAVGAKLEANLARQLQTQFQTIGKQALQETLRTCFEGSLLPHFERSCQEMFMQVDGTFQRGMSEHTTKAQQQFASSHSDLASTLKEAVTSASHLAESLKVDLAESHKKLVAYVESTGTHAGAHAALGGQPNIALPDKVLSLRSLEESLDPTVKLSKLVAEGKLEEAFTVALSLSDITIVSWLIDQVDAQTIFAKSPPPLSQGVLLSLVQQLGCDLAKDTANKLTWIREAALALNPDDPILAPHMRPFLQQLYQNLHAQLAVTSSGELLSALRLVLHVVNSLLTSCN